MKWFKLICTVLVIGLIITGVVLSVTGNNFNLIKKNFQTNYNHGLEREVIVSNALTGEVIWTYNGKCYLNNESEPGNIAIIYFDGDAPKKVDFVGNMINLAMIEK